MVPQMAQDEVLDVNPVWRQQLPKSHLITQSEHSWLQLCQFDAKDQIKNAGEFGTMGMSRMVTHVKVRDERLSWEKLETLVP